jgi:competence protein ComEA
VTERSTIAVWAIAAVLAVVAGWRLVGGGAGEEAPPPVRVDAPGARAGAAQAGAAAEPLYVHVAGAVRRPGLLRVRDGTRVATAVARAGGPTARADLTLVNLAARLQDGQQIVVPVRGATATATGTDAAPGALPGAPIHLSSATVDQLDEIDGIGPTLAERIVEHRDANGGVGSIEELGEVDGIGEQRLATLREALQP